MAGWTVGKESALMTALSKRLMQRHNCVAHKQGKKSELERADSDGSSSERQHVSQQHGKPKFGGRASCARGTHNTTTQRP
ncbi:unnamed protein product [Ceratitis capitata]|uniref:(Mediterranean fruit fly) hypothetical protein n=1 Tax=Ceratitis capitata TaxID=7213 RepID=A0A811U0P8_CERCA|nr:unnamed protein product [Ceratitis capitata]